MSVAGTIIDYAENQNIDLIVVGSTYSQIISRTNKLKFYNMLGEHI